MSKKFFLDAHLKPPIGPSHLYGQKKFQVPKNINQISTTVCTFRSIMPPVATMLKFHQVVLCICCQKKTQFNGHLFLLIEAK